MVAAPAAPAAHKKSASLAWLSRSKSIITGGPSSASSSASTNLMTPSGSSDGASIASSSGASMGGLKLMKVWSDAGREREREKDKERGKEAVGMTRDHTAVPKVILGAVKDDWPLYSCRPQDYAIGEPIGFGSSSVVHLATYAPPATSSLPRPDPIKCAVKIIDVDKLSRAADIDRLRRETQLMALSKHPNVLRVRGEWVQGSKLFIACRYMSPGSLLDIARYAHQDGFEESVIATVLKQALEGLAYLHQNGWLHRDVKAANLLADDDGTVLLADFGVSSSLFADASSPQLDETVATRGFASRKSFVGTPCWMAPEIVERREYDSKADIWSLGITTLELALGHAPNSLFPPAKVLSKTILDAPPQLDREGGKYKYSKAMKDMVESCLKKDPKKRPSAEKLLQHPFFKLAKRKGHLVNTILSDLPPLELRQDRRRKPSMTLADSTSSWDFASSVPSTPGIVGGPTYDPFANFNTSPAGSVVRQQPVSADGPPAARTPVALLSLLRRREGSATSLSTGMPPSPTTHTHRRGISFDLAAPVPPSPKSPPATFAEIVEDAEITSSRTDGRAPV
ncbi:hypothetical protein RQP46_010948 [Phenoliferia psychrophenolica]